MSFERLKQLNDQNADEQAEMVEKAAQASQLLDVQETVVKSFQRLVDYLDQRVSRTQVVNQLKEIGTPDALRVVDAVNQLHTTLQGKDVDLSPIIDVLREELSKVSESVKAIPQVDMPEPIDTRSQLEGLSQAIKAVEEAVKAQQTTVEAPVVNVEAPQVTVEAQDLKPFAKELESSFKKAVGLINIPEVDFSDVVKHQKETTNAVKELNKTLEEMPAGGGGGGSSSIAPFLNDQGQLPVTMSAGLDPRDFYTYDQEEGTTSYYGKTHYSTGNWMVLRLTDTLVSYATVTNNVAVTTYTDAWTDRAILTFGRIDEAF